MRARLFYFLAISALCHVRAKVETEEDDPDSGEQNLDSGEANKTQTEPPQLDEKDNMDPDDSSSESIGATVSQIYRHPYAASLLKNNSYVCSAVILNTYWLITQSKCFDTDIIASYVTHRNLGNFTIRVGSSYNNKGGALFKLKMLINNFDLKVSAVKLESPLEFGSRVRSVRLPNPDEEVTLGYLATVLAWTPVGHMRLVNAPVIEATICESYTKLLPGHFICMGGVQDPNRHFCRKDDGGAVVQNNTLIAISSFLHKCALYSRSHAFPKVSSFSRWLDSVIWDEDNRPTTIQVSTPSLITKTMANVTETPPEPRNVYQDPRKFLLTLPFDPINVPLEPAEDNSVIPRMSLYESYLQNLARAKTSTTMDPDTLEKKRQEWIHKFGNSPLLMPPAFQNQLDYV
ncbi:trypsin-6-like [Choristoneura fumiferana]|uniref:trypsin-6-like n=1 Tax=Choristoneura fumiferana TaxID=7141 RepID=UPI003D158BD9